MDKILLSCEYIIIYQNELYIASTTLEEILYIAQDKHKIKINLNVYLGSNFPHDPRGTMICWRKYIEKLYAKVNILFKDKFPIDLHIAFEIIKLVIKKGNLNLIHNKNTYVHFNHSSRMRKLDKLNTDI